MAFLWFLFLTGLGYGAANHFSFADSTQTSLPAEKGLADSLDRYLQWGLFDSLFLASSVGLRQYQHESPEQQSRETSAKVGLLHHYRALASLGQTDTVAAMHDFVAAACWKSAMRLDSFYIPQPMIRFNDSVFREVEAHPSLCPSMPEKAQDTGISHLGKLSREGKPNKWLAATTWSLAGLAAVGLGAAASEQAAASDALDKQAKAGLVGDKEAYDREGRSVRSHLNRRNVALVSTLVLGTGSALAYYQNRRLQAKIRPNAIAVNWSF